MSFYYSHSDVARLTHFEYGGTIITQTSLPSDLRRGLCPPIGTYQPVAYVYVYMCVYVG